MSTAVWTAPPSPRVGDEDLGERGRTTIDDAVVEKIATRAVGEVDQIGGVATRVLGMALGPGSADRAPKVAAHVDGTTVTLRVRCSVTYPAPVGAVSQQVREHVIERVDELTGLATRQVDITVAALPAPQAAQRELR